MRGAGWAIAVRWTMRLLGLISTIFLARLLTPTDFGIVAIAMIIAGTIEIFSQTGQGQAIIRLTSPTREHYDSAWTVSVLLGLGLGVLIWLSAPIAVAYFHEPRARSVVQVLAFRTMVIGLANIGTVNFRRDLRFRAQFAFDTAPSIVAFVVTLTAAFALRNYWALVIGVLSQQATTVALSYILEPFRPRFSFAKVGEIWSFSIWTLTRSIGVYLIGQVDKFAVGGFAGSATMGRYEVATDVASAPTVEINGPMIATLFPVMSRVHHDVARRRQLYLQALYWSALICTATSVGVALVTSDMVDLVLGRQWVDVKPLMPWLALAYGVFGLSGSVYSAFDVIGRPRISAILQWTRLAALILCIAPVAFIFKTALAVAITRFAVTVAITPTLFVALARALDISFRDLVTALWRPLVASAVMAAAVLGVNTLIGFVGPGRLLIDITLGAITYSGFLLFVWNLIGRPDGPEALVWKYLQGVPRTLLRWAHAPRDSRVHRTKAAEPGANGTAPVPVSSTFSEGNSPGT
jgi:O-antigen/teichoic acid export membrane protein